MAVMSPAEMAALRDEILTSLRPAMAGQGQAMTALTPFLQGQPGSSPLTDAAIKAFQVKTAPIIQQQMTLKGLGHSPAVSQVTGETLAMALPEFINADMANRLAAARMVGDLGTGSTNLAASIGKTEADLGLTGTRLASDIANQEANRRIEAARVSGQLQLGLGDINVRAGQLQQGQQQLALQAGQGAGGLQRDIQQAVSDATQAERLRLQSLSEAGSFGMLGSPSVPPALQQSTRTSGSSK